MMKTAKRILILVLTLAIVSASLGLGVLADTYYGDVAWGAATVRASLLNIRAGCSTGYEIVGTIPNGTRIVILEKTEAGWYKINYNGTVGYVCTDYLVEVVTAENFDATGMLTGDSVRLRSQPSTGSDVLGYYYSGTKLHVIGINSGWYKITDGSVTGYIRSDLMTITGGYTGLETAAPAEQAETAEAAPAEQTAEASTEAAPAEQAEETSTEAAPAEQPAEPAPVSAESTGVGAQVAELAKQYVGYRYVYGGSTPGGGFDCSGLAMYCWAQFGYSLPHSATAQYNCSVGYPISKADLQPGDLVFFNGDGDGISHVGIYIGGGQMVHASGSRVGVIISDLSSSYYTRTYWCAKRVAD